MNCYPFKLIAIVMLITCVICVLCSCGNKPDYSPLDTYVNGIVEKAKDSTRHANEVKAFLDSINNR